MSARNRRRYFRVILALLSLSVCSLLLEALSWVVLTKVMGQQRRYQADEVLGWTLRPSLLLDLDGHDFATDTDGLRCSAGYRAKSTGLSWSESNGRRILIAGDSFVEAKDVGYEQRFDHVLTQEGANVLSVGCGGFGTDQQLLASKPWMDGLRQGDCFVLLTCGNDFKDMLRRHHSGRAKPYYDRNYELHAPDLGFYQVARDELAVCTLVNAILGNTQHDFDQESLRWSFGLYVRLLSAELAPLVDRGVRVMVAHHSDWIAGFEPDWDQVPQERIEVLALDPHIVGDGPKNASHPNLCDYIHWSASGHEAAGRSLQGALRR